MFDAGAIVGRLVLDKGAWNRSVASVSQDQEKMKSGFSSFTKSFKDNWLAATAAITAGIVVVSRAWALMEAGTKAEQMEAGFMGIAASAGIAGEKLKQALKEASAFTVEFSEIAGVTSSLIGRSLNTQQIVALMQVARAEARKTGETVEQAYNTLANAVTGGFTRALQTSYGVNVDATLAVANYARATGMTTEKVEQFYKSQAIANEILKQTAKDVRATSAGMLTHYERIQQMQARWKEFMETVGMGIYNVMVILGSTIGIVMSAIADVIDTTVAAIQHSFAFIIGMMEKLVFFIPVIKNGLDALRKQFDSSADDYNAKAQANLNAIGSYYMEIVGSLKDMVSGGANETKGMFGDIQAGAEEMTVAVKMTVNQWLAQLKQDFNAALEFTQGVYNAMQSTFKSVVVDGIKGDLQSMESYFVNFGNLVIDVIGEIIAKWVAMKVITGAVSAVTSAFSLGSGMVSTGNQSVAGHSFTSAFNGTSAAGYADGISYVPEAGLYKLHKGETVAPKYDSGKGQGLVVTIQNLITPEAVAMAMSGKEGEGVIVNVIDSKSLRNGSTRRTIQAR